MTGLLFLGGLRSGYGGNSVLHDVSLTLEGGEMAVLLGANGAGKSTLLRAVLGLVPITAGRLEFDGVDVANLTVERRVGLGIGYVPEGRRVFAGMSVRDNLEVAGSASSSQRRSDLERIFTLFPSLRVKADEKAWRLSGGQQQMLALGRALMGRPRLLLLDEPSLGLAPKVAAEVFATVRGLSTQGMSVLVAEQSFACAASLRARTILLAFGRIIHDGAIEKLSTEDARRAFMGVHLSPEHSTSAPGERNSNRND